MISAKQWLRSSLRQSLLLNNHVHDMRACCIATCISEAAAGMFSIQACTAIQPGLMQLYPGHMDGCVVDRCF